MDLLLAILYTAGLLVLCGFGLHGLAMVVNYRRLRPVDPPTPSIPAHLLPGVTVQLPIYNELHVAGRLVEAVCAFDYPADRLQIQVLDDSTDETTEMLRHAIQEQRGRGHEWRQATLQKYRDYVKAGRDFPLSEFRGRHSAATEAVGYGKTAMGFHMLRLRMGDDAFRRMLGAVRWVRRHQVWVTRIGGLMLIAVGILLVSGIWDLWVAYLRGWVGSFSVVV